MSERRNLFVLDGDRRQVSYLHALPALWRKPGTVLYVGANLVRWHGGPELVAFGHRLTILEIWPENAAAFEGVVDRVIVGDVRRLDELLPYARFDIAFWWHGPEHVERREVGAALADLEARADLVVLGCPWGEYPQGRYPNPYEDHLCALYPPDFELLGYDVWTTGRPDDPETGRIVAWKEPGRCRIID